MKRVNQSVSYASISFGPFHLRQGNRYTGKNKQAHTCNMNRIKENLYREQESEHAFKKDRKMKKLKILLLGDYRAWKRAKG